MVVAGRSRYHADGDGRLIDCGIPVAGAHGEFDDPRSNVGNDHRGVEDEGAVLAGFGEALRRLDQIAAELASDRIDSDRSAQPVGSGTT